MLRVFRFPENMPPLSILFTVAIADDLIGNSFNHLKTSENIFTHDGFQGEKMDNYRSAEN